MNGASSDSPGGSPPGSGERLPDEDSEGNLLPRSDSPVPKRKNPVVRGLNFLLDFINSTAVQTTMYIAFVYIFQTIAETVRLPKLEYYFNKQIADVFLENHFDGSHNAFGDIRRVGDIWEWGNTVLWSGFYSNSGPCRPDVGSSTKVCNDDAWPDGEGSFHLEEPTPYTVPELVKWMDLNDWTEGVVIKTSRVQMTSPEICTTHQLSGACYPELKPFGTGEEDQVPFGYNWTHPDEPPEHPWRYWSAAELGSNPEGQMSAAVPSMRMMPTSGFAAFVIPFFSTSWLEEQKGLCDPAEGEVTWYKDTYINATSANKRAAFYCLRLSWNGVQCHQLCDPTDAVGGPEEQMETLEGRNTGVVRHQTELFWNDLKRGHFIDARTRVITIVLQLRSNHVGIRYRTTLMFETTSLGAVLPSYDVETRTYDDERLGLQRRYIIYAVSMCSVFVLLEGIEIVGSGPIEYFMNMWNVMDWLNFAIFFLTWATMLALDDYVANRECGHICSTVGYYDDWRVMATARTVKIYLSTCVCIQLLKIIKFTNVLIPKMSLMTSVLSKGKADLAFFGIVFGISMLAFSNMFYVQLGSVMEDYNDQVASVLSLARALFGDFDIDDIMNNSSGYLNAVLFLIYLFVAVFILLSMFLAILGESQAAVRSDQDDEKNSGEAPPEYGIFFYSGQALGWVHTRLRTAWAASRARTHAAKRAEGGEGGEEKDDYSAAGSSEGGGGDTDRSQRANLFTSALEEMVAEVKSTQKMVRSLARQVSAAKARPAGGGAAADARALYKVVARAEASLSERFASIEERVAAADAKKKERSRAKEAAATGLPQQEGLVGGSPAASPDASPAGGRSRRPSDAAAAPPPPADPSGAALPRMMADSEPGSMDEDDTEHTTQC